MKEIRVGLDQKVKQPIIKEDNATWILSGEGFN